MATLKKQAEDLGIDVDNRWSDETLQRKIDEAKAKKSADDVATQTGANAPIHAADAKIIPNIGQPRAQTSEEMRQDAEDGGAGRTQAAPYPGDPKAAHEKAMAYADRQTDPAEFKSDDLKGTSINGEEKQDTVVVRLLYDWWDGQGVRHPLNSEVEMAINDARNLIEQRKAERTDPL